ncbi:MAG: hypothetical protein Udaeo2_29090 [Candidatus Udaeobacter sp.]|nr:MAG: hypothetical protein Udaeo2_29090 [Candidatus Udaeobacter sp.]
MKTERASPAPWFAVTWSCNRTRLRRETSRRADSRSPRACRTVDIETNINAAGRSADESIATTEADPRIMHHVERRDHIKLRRQSLSTSRSSKRTGLTRRLARIRRRASNGRTKVVVAHVTRPRKRLRSLIRRDPSASHVSQVTTRSRCAFTSGMARDPLLQQQILKPSGVNPSRPTSCRCIAIENATATAKRSQDLVELRS